MTIIEQLYAIVKSRPPEQASEILTFAEFIRAQHLNAKPAKRTQQLKQFLSRVNLVPFDRNSAVAAATIRAQLEQQGTPIGPRMF